MQRKRRHWCCDDMSRKPVQGCNQSKVLPEDVDQRSPSAHSAGRAGGGQSSRPLNCRCTALHGALHGFQDRRSIIASLVYS